MKVLYIINSLNPYGAEKSMVQMALSFETITPIFVSLFSVDGDLTSFLKLKGIKNYELDLDNRNDVMNNAIQKIIPIIDSEKPEILHSVLFQSDMIARKLKQIFPDIILVGSLVNNSYSKKRFSNLNLISRLKLLSTQFRDRHTINKVDYFISNSHAIVKPNIQALGITRERIKVIHRGRSLDTKSRTPLNSDLSKIVSNKLVFLTVGRLSKQKGHLDLIHAFKKIHSKRKDIILLIAGEGSLREEIEKQINDFELENNIYLLGYRTDILTLLQNSHFFIFPSYFEGLSGALIEAILAKKPCIVSDIEENKECFPGEGALFFPPGNIQKLIESIQKSLVLSEREWTEKIYSSYNYARDHFDLLKNKNKYEIFYREIIKK